MANSLYQAILDKVKQVTKPKAPKIPGRTPVIGLPDERRTSPTTTPQSSPDTSVIPFAPGRIYKSIYTNWHHDPRPLIFILSSNAFYTHAINIHYLETQQRNMMHMIKNMKDSGKVWTGLMMYQYMKNRYPAIPSLGYRMYFTKYLKGKLVSDGISQNPLPGKARFFAEPFIRQLNDMLGKEERLKPDELETMRAAEDNADRISMSRR
jgi:hypothetical protein